MVLPTHTHTQISNMRCILLFFSLTDKKTETHRDLVAELEIQPKFLDSKARFETTLLY